MCIYNDCARNDLLTEDAWSGQEISNASANGGIEKAPLMPDIVSTLKDIGYFNQNSG